MEGEQTSRMKAYTVGSESQLFPSFSPSGAGFNTSISCGTVFFFTNEVTFNLTDWSNSNCIYNWYEVTLFFGWLGIQDKK